MWQVYRSVWDGMSAGMDRAIVWSEQVSIILLNGWCVVITCTCTMFANVSRKYEIKVDSKYQCCELQIQDRVNTVLHRVFRNWDGIIKCFSNNSFLKKIVLSY